MVLLLALDIGNSNIAMGVFDGRTLCFRAKLSAATERSADEYAALMYDLLRINGISRESLHGCMMGSVVPHLTGLVKEAVETLAQVPVLQVGPGTKTGFRIRIDDPSQLGADLAADTAAVLAEYGAPAILIDAGTVTTLAAVDRDRTYLGGCILPGLYSSAQLMKSATALLPSISFSGSDEQVIGKNSADAMRLGLLYGSAMMVDGFLDRFLTMDGMAGANIVATGGSAELVTGKCRHAIHLDRDLTLKGLRLLYELNQKGKRI